MMNHHMPAGSGHQHHSSHPNHNSHYSQSHRQRDYHAYYSHPPQSPIHSSQYAGGYYPHAPQQYYPAQYQGYPQHRWAPHPQMPYPQQYMPQHAPLPPMQYYQRPPYDVNAEFRPNSRQSGLPQYPQSPAVPPPQSPSSRPPTSSDTTPAQELGSVEETRTSQQEVVEQAASTNPLQEEPEHKTPFRPQLPWYSPTTSASAFPPRATLRRKKRTAFVANDNVLLPSRGGAQESPAQSATPEASERTRLAEDISSEVSTVAAPSDAETPATSHAPSESECRDSTPTTPAPTSEASPKPTPTQSQHQRRDTRTAVAIPVLPKLPRHKGAPSVDKQPTAVAETEAAVEEPAAVQELPKPIIPKSWADLVRIQGAKVQAPVLMSDGIISNAAAKNATLAEALKQYVVSTDQISFFEPRGLVNTGNMCYMNSILQVLVFCVPFFSFLDQVRSRTVHSIKSDTPLLDAMIMFMRELKVIASADSVDALRKTLKPAELEKYGDPITPEYIYDAIKHLPRFQSMRRGHQQDAEEFLGFVLEGLHDECIAVMQGDNKQTNPTEAASEQGEGDGWLEVGPKQKAAITRTAGQQDAPSPVTKIFGGHLRSELRVPGQKDSVTLEPYKPLQLDIGAPHINSIVDALKNITHTETLTGDFGGRGNTAKKQVFIDSLPPVLILHLKRFQFDNNLTGTQKIWKKIGYPLELEIPKEVFPQSKRSGFAGGKPLPRYRLTSVVYHHGKSAAGGHYTVDVLRQDFKEWVRIDDTFIRRIRPEDVAEGGAGEDPKILARALEQHRAAQELQKQRNMYEGLEDDEQSTPWSEVNGSAEKKAKLVNGATPAGVATPSSTTGKRTPTAKREGVKDNKVAYILLYERIDL